MAARLREARRLHIPDREVRSRLEGRGLVYSTYMCHEGGSRDFSKHAPRYAFMWKVNVLWLMTGKGPRESEEAKAEDPDFQEFQDFKAWRSAKRPPHKPKKS